MMAIYGREIYLLDCDEFTRGYYEDRGVDLGDVVKMGLPKRVVPKQVTCDNYIAQFVRALG